MKINVINVIGDRVDGSLRLSITTEAHKDDRKLSVNLNAAQAELLITYLKGLRDGMGWNTKAAADRSL